MIKISRRNFLKLLAGGVAAAVLPVPVLPNEPIPDLELGTPTISDTLIPYMVLQDIEPGYYIFSYFFKQEGFDPYEAKLSPGSWIQQHCDDWFRYGCTVEVTEKTDVKIFIDMLAPEKPVIVSHLQLELSAQGMKDKSNVFSIGSTIEEE